MPSASDFLSAPPAGEAMPEQEGGKRQSASDFLGPAPTSTSAGAGAGAPNPPTAPQQTGIARAIDFPASNLASGTTGLLGMPGTLTAAAERYAEKLGVPKAAIPFLWPLTHGMPTTEEMNAGLNKVGNALGVGPVIDRPDLAPQNAPERYGGAIVRAVPAAVATLATGGAALPTALSTVGSATASQGAKDLGFGPGVQLAAGIAGGGAGGALGSALSPQTVEKVASTLGESSTMQQAGEHLQDSARDWLANVKPAREAEAWEPVNAELGDIPTPLTATGKALDSITGEGGPLSGMMATLRPKLPEALQKQFDAVFGRAPLPASKVTGTGTWEDYMRRVMPQQPTWEDVKNLRSALGDYMGRPDMMKDLGEENAQRIYGALTEDMRNVADTHGYADLFDNANAQSSALNDTAEKVMKKIVADAKPSRNDPAPGEAANAVLRGAQHDGTTLATLRNEIPDAVDELAAAHLRMQSPKYAKLNPQGSAPASLSPEAFAALVPNPTTRALISSVVPKPGPSAAHGISESIGSAGMSAFLEQVLAHSVPAIAGPEGAVGAALLGAGLPGGLRILRNVGALPGIGPGALQGAMASPSAILGVTNPPK